MNTILVSKFYAKYKAYLCPGWKGEPHLGRDGTAAARTAGAAATTRPGAGGSVRGPSSPGGRCLWRGWMGVLYGWPPGSAGSYLPFGAGPKAWPRPRITPRHACDICLIFRLLCGYPRPKCHGRRSRGASSYPRSGRGEPLG